MFDEVQVVRSVSRSDTRTAGYETCLRNEKSERVCFFFFFFGKGVFGNSAYIPSSLPDQKLKV